MGNINSKIFLLLELFSSYICNFTVLKRYFQYLKTHNYSCLFKKKLNRNLLFDLEIVEISF